MAERKGPFCGAERRHGKGPCQLAAGAGTDHLGYGRCSWHGGCAPSGRKAALDAQARAELARLDVAPLADPLSQLALLAGQAVAWKDAMAERVNALAGLRYESADGAEQLRAEVALWERALDRCERFLSSMARLKIDERLTKISETQGHVIVSFIMAALARFGIDYADDQTHAIVMSLFDRMRDGDGREPTAAIEAPKPPGLTAVCEMGQHGACRSYMLVDAMPDPPPWPARCPCPCHDPARNTPRDWDLQG
jgi:hypothetical protein